MSLETHIHLGNLYHCLHHRPIYHLQKTSEDLWDCAPIDRLGAIFIIVRHKVPITAHGRLAFIHSFITPIFLNASVQCQILWSSLVYPYSQCRVAGTDIFKTQKFVFNYKYNSCYEREVPVRKKVGLFQAEAQNMQGPEGESWDFWWIEMWLGKNRGKGERSQKRLERGIMKDIVNHSFHFV